MHKALRLKLSKIAIGFEIFQLKSNSRQLLPELRIGDKLFVGSLLLDGVLVDVGGRAVLRVGDLHSLVLLLEGVDHA